MKKFLFIVVISLFSLTANAGWGIEAEPLFENAEGILCLGKASPNLPTKLIKTDSVPLAYRDTVLSDGTLSRLYFLPYSSLTSRDSKKHFFVHWQFPDGVRILLDKDSTSFLYPSGLQPGLYNFVSKHIEVVNDYNMGSSEVAYIGIEYLNTRKQDSPYSKPYSTKDCQYRNVSMYANVKVLDESKALVTRNSPKFYVRVIDADSDEKADFNVHVVSNNRWGTDCAQWRWVDSDEDFCVIFGYGGNFTIRLIEK